MEEKHKVTTGKMLAALIFSLLLLIPVGMGLLASEFYIPLYFDYYIVTLFEPEIRALPLQTTSDGVYEYCLQTRNVGLGSVYVQLYVREIATGEEFTINIEKIKQELHKTDLNMRGILESAEKEGIYTLETITEISSNRTYMREIDMNTHAIIKIFEIVHYESIITTVHDEEGNLSYRFWIELRDIYEDDVRIDIEVLLIIRYGNIPRRYIELSIDDEIILTKTDILQRVNVDEGNFQRPTWVIVEETEVEGQLIIQTNEEFSTEITLTFLVDVYAGTAEEITVKQT